MFFCTYLFMLAIARHRGTCICSRCKTQQSGRKNQRKIEKERANARDTAYCLGSKNQALGLDFVVVVLYDLSVVFYR